MQIEKFLLEPGSGFMFVGTQQWVTLNNIHYYVDMVFYNKPLRAYVLIELKTVKLLPEAILREWHEPKAKYGARGAEQARALTAEVSGLFLSGKLADEELDEMMRGIQEAYWIAKKEQKVYHKEISQE